MWSVTVQVLRKLKTDKRFYVTKTVNKQPVKYTETINLPKTKFPTRLNAKARNEIEANINRTCFSNLYQWQANNLKDKEFVLHDGPPYANGDLHMGHAINKILKDITLRHRVIRKYLVHYVPGWDCHGLPIELKAMSNTNISDPLTIRNKAREFAFKTIEKQKQEFSSWGVMADWNNNENIYKTFDADYVKNQLQIFYKLFQNGLIFRDLKPVYWSPSSKTALAEAELEYDQNFKSPSLYLRLKCTEIPEILQSKIGDKNNLYALIWTTTPWTLPANQAICYNGNLVYSLVSLKNDFYLVAKALIPELCNVLKTDLHEIFNFDSSEISKMKYFHPIMKSAKMPFLSASHVAASKGTGLVHTAPAHGFDDYLVGLKNNISTECMVDENGNYNEKAPEFLQSKNVLIDGNDAVLHFLNEEDIILNSNLIHSYPIDWRTKQPVIIRASEQWFINTEKIKDKALEEIENIKIFPHISSEVSKNTLKTQLDKRPYWCISRQRVWGVPIPVFLDKNTKKPLINSAIIDHLCNLIVINGNADFWWTKHIEEILPLEIIDNLNVKVSDLEKGNDILDIWFDSGISWSYALKDSHIADLYLEGIDQFTGWFQSSLMTSVAFRNIAPYKAIFVHGFVLDEKGQKMSKSLGNIIEPKDVTKKYGIDAMRWWIAAHATQHTSIPVGDKILESSSENVQKIRSIFKYLIGVVGNCKLDHLPSDLSTFSVLDRYLLNKLHQFQKQIFTNYDDFQYNRVTAITLNFIVNELSGLYLHLTKDRLYCGTQNQYEQVQQIIFSSLFVLCQTLWPILPFTVEECWSYFEHKMPFYKSTLTLPPNWSNDDPLAIMEKCITLRQQLNKSTVNCNSWNLNVSLICSGEYFRDLKVIHPVTQEFVSDSELCEILQVSSVKLSLGKESLNDNDFSMIIEKNEKSLCPRCRRFLINENETNICARCDLVLKEKSLKNH